MGIILVVFTLHHVAGSALALTGPLGPGSPYKKRKLINFEILIIYMCVYKVPVHKIRREYDTTFCAAGHVQKTSVTLRRCGMCVGRNVSASREKDGSL